MKDKAIVDLPVLETERLILREPKDEDCTAIFQLRSDEQVNKYLSRPITTDISETAEFLRKINKGIANNESLYWVLILKEEAVLIGSICLWNFSENRSEAEIGYELNPAFQGHGYIKEALLCMLNYAFETLQLDAVNAYTHPENTVSINLLKRHGFVLQSEANKDEQDPDLRYVLKRESI